MAQARRRCLPRPAPLPRTRMRRRSANETRCASLTDDGSFSVPPASALLAAGDVGVIQSAGQVTAKHGASTAPYLAWMRDSLVLREAPISEVSSELRRWYGVALRVDDTSLARRHLTMTVAGDPIDRVLRMIGLQLGADVERRGDSAIVRPSTWSVRPQ